MNRYQFEDLISDYIENKLPIAKRKELEAFMEANPEAKDQLESIRSLMKSMKKLPEVKTSDQFTAKLMKRVEFEKNRPSAKKYVTSTVGKTYFGFTPAYATVMTALVVAFVVVGMQLVPKTNNNSTVLPTSITAETSTIPKSTSPKPYQNDDIMLAEDHDSTDVDGSARVKSGQFDDKIKLVGNK
jgi:anti-sigma factor RsiW